jgi:hypothetical protein
MSELIRRAASKPDSPFKPTVSSFSPLAKSSKSALRRIAPLLTVRRTPPPQVQAPAPVEPRKTKKMLRLEETWMEELEDEIEGWLELSDKERSKHLKRKRDQYLFPDE